MLVHPRAQCKGRLVPQIVPRLEPLRSGSSECLSTQGHNLTPSGAAQTNACRLQGPRSGAVCTSDCTSARVLRAHFPAALFFFIGGAMIIHASTMPVATSMAFSTVRPISSRADTGCGGRCVLGPRKHARPHASAHPQTLTPTHPHITTKATAASIKTCITATTLAKSSPTPFQTQSACSLKRYDRRCRRCCLRSSVDCLCNDRK